LAATASSAFLSSASFFFDLDFGFFASVTLVDFGVAAAPLAALGVALVVSLILGFLTESDRRGVW
jgi:hypothetical protein